jgi:predicted RNase H-like HicB family nuclease
MSGAKETVYVNLEVPIEIEYIDGVYVASCPYMPGMVATSKTRFGAKMELSASINVKLRYDNKLP